MTTNCSLPDPPDLGFPAKFQHWYPDQVRAIDRVLTSRTRVTALNMPTGSGKSVTGIAAALLHPHVKRVIYLTSTKGLQDQLAVDFKDLGLFDVRGKRNYPCRAIEPGGELAHFFPVDDLRIAVRRARQRYLSCEDGPCHAGVTCSMAPDRTDVGIRPQCEYYAAIHDARQVQLLSTNYSMYLSHYAFAQGFNEFDMLVCDEAHDADKELESFLTFEVTKEDAGHIGTKLPQAAEAAIWRDWGAHHYGSLHAMIEQRELQPPVDQEGARDLRRLKEICGKLERLKDINPFEWVIDMDPMRGKLAPMQVAAYAERYLFRGVPHIVLMSATMTRKTAQLLGIPADDLTFHSVPSAFPVERRPIILTSLNPPVRVDARMSDDDKYMWMRRIDRIIEPRRALGRKGIIHTVSYQRMRELIARSEHRDLMLVHDSANTRETIQAFKDSTDPRILVSPAIVTGYDFPDDQCRYQIIGKLPMPDMRGPIMSIRKDLDPDYPGYLAMVKLVQACGRAVRNPRDWAETFIVDDHFAQWFLNKNRKHAPRWFLDALLEFESLPEPLFV